MMEFTTAADRGPLAPYVIGDPGRAALEVPAGPPNRRLGSADVELSAATLPGLQIRAATVRGVHRRAYGKPRQDAFALGRCGTNGGPERAIAVVCDGIGAFGGSEETALLLSQHLAGLAAEGVLWPDAFAQASKAITAHLAATLLAGRNRDDAHAHGLTTAAAGLAVYRDGDYWLGQAAWAGDSSLWHLGTDGQWAMLAGDPDKPGAARYSAPAEPLPSPEAHCTTTEFCIAGGMLFVMTDGVANPLRWSEQVQETLAQWWKQPPDPFTFAAQVGFARKSHIDDRTVIGIWPDDGG